MLLGPVSWASGQGWQCARSRQVPTWGFGGPGCRVAVSALMSSLPKLLFYTLCPNEDLSLSILPRGRLLASSYDLTFAGP